VGLNDEVGFGVVVDQAKEWRCNFRLIEPRFVRVHTTRIFYISHEYFPGIFIPHKTRSLPRKNS
jgi:hypothetical protein